MIRCLPKGGVSQEVCESAWRGNSWDVRVVYHLLGRGIGRVSLSEKYYRRQILNFPSCGCRCSSFWFGNEGYCLGIISVGESEQERSETCMGLHNGSELWPSSTQDIFGKVHLWRLYMMLSLFMPMGPANLLHFLWALRTSYSDTGVKKQKFQPSKYKKSNRLY